MSGSCPPDVRTYNIRMPNHYGCHKTSDAEKLLDEIVSKGLNPNIIHFNTLIGGFCRDNNNMTETKRIFSDISRKGCVQGAVTYSTFIYFLSKGGHFDRAYEICSESMPKNLMPNLKIAKMLIDAL